MQKTLRVPVRPLIDDLAPMSSLRVEYENGSPAFLKQIDWLNAHGFTYIRRTRGDGDCFYRSFGFTYVERLLQSPDRELAVSRSLKSLQSTNQKLESAGIQALVFEDFLDVFTSLIEGIVKPGNEGGTLNAEGLLKAFQSDEGRLISNATVMYLRLLTSAQILLDRDFFQSFVVHPDTKEPMDVDSFCANFVQALGKEADNVEMNALCSALELNLDVAYLNGGRTGVVDFIEFRSDANPEADPLMLLYRPGHYDILVRAS
ncbi:peptidase C65 Otubain-domain-containing protein [Crucibulum laeve]|uniref:ubiquitinyl hydrolase 1 n=1 Tax=Crucibulum laeve TaxID=68775 RepID=A0A5C3LYY3_9AGAR|nr:peptidase C65 Otubain-domain-containing protein [Crucibulum laeve]